MTKWRCVCALLVLSSAGACATPTNGGEPLPDVAASGSGDTAGAGLVAASGGPPAIDHEVAGATSAGGASADAGAPPAAGSSGGKGGASANAGSAGVALGGAAAAAAGSAGASFGGQSGTSSSGGSSAGSAGSVSGSACANPKDVSGGKSDNLGTTGPVCMRTKETFNTVGCSNFAGRTIKVNGVLATCNVKTTFAPPVDGYNYFDVSAGDVDFAAFVWYTS